MEVFGENMIFYDISSTTLLGPYPGPGTWPLAMIRAYSWDTVGIRTSERVCLMTWYSDMFSFAVTKMYSIDSVTNVSLSSAGRRHHVSV